MALGALLLAAGVILGYVVDVDVPFVEDDALGSWLITGGVLLLGIGLALRAARATRGSGHGVGSGVDSGPTSAGAGLAMFVVGAALAFAVEVDVPYVWDEGLGAILLVAGIVTMVATVALDRQQRRTRTVVHRVR